MEKKATAIQRLKQALAENTLGGLYVFHGEEKYLLQHYLEQVKKTVLRDGMEDFNLRVLNAETAGPEDFREAVERLPVFAEKTLVILKDVDVMRPDAKWQAVLEDVISDIPEYTVIVCVYDTLEYKTDARAKYHKQISAAACIVEFKYQDKNDLIPWLARRFRALDRKISRPDAEYMIFYAGTSMERLIGEIEKAAAYAKSEIVTRGDIEAVCTPELEAVMYGLCDDMIAGKFAHMAETLRDLLFLKYEPIVILGAFGRQIRQLYMTKRLMASGVIREGEIAELLAVRSPYAVRRLMASSGKIEGRWLEEAVRACGLCDFQMKSSGMSRETLLKDMLMTLAGSLYEKGA
ncbi:DNA polymerase III subunit delta [Oscillospiraceae bacterium OttesenSCG-928-F05]|nr:DNA polymerase III subunit delta [Oscillospiraceae bacterium OttesenSCG-928-F05]